jgi:proliferating cell nuclear antigen
MFEATLATGSVLKKLVDAMKELVGDANLDCSETGLSLQAMDASHVSLVSLALHTELFQMYRCDTQKSLGVNFGSLSKILKCASNEDKITIKAGDDDEKVSFIFESDDKITDFDMQLMTIDAEHLGIPDTEYMAVITMPSAEFMRICRDLSIIGETCTIAASKEGVRFTVQGDLGTGNITLRETSKADVKPHEKVSIKIDAALELTFALTYLNNFTKATPLSPIVTLKLAPEVPLVVEYPIESGGHLRYYLAPKIDEEDE